MMLATKTCKQLLILFLALAVCAGVAFAQAQEPFIGKHLQLSNDHLETGDSGAHFVVGTINNLGDKMCDVTVRMNLYGATQTFIANRQAHRAGLESGGTWDFRIRCSPNVMSYQILSVRARWY